MAEGLDYSFGRPNIAQAVAGGIKFVVRYLSSGSKGITASELASLHAAGLDVAFVYEGAGSSALGGSPAGVGDMRAAVQLAKALGVPAGKAIYLPTDFDATSSQMSAVVSYYAGAATEKGSYKLGVYGKRDVVAAVLGSHATYGWTTYAWSGGAAPVGHLYQYQNDITLYGAGVDRTRSLVADFGQWPAKTVTPPADEALIVNASDEAKIKAIVQAAFDSNRDSYAIRVCQRLMARIGQSLFNHSLAQGVKMQKIMDKLGVK